MPPAVCADASPPRVPACHHRPTGDGDCDVELCRHTMRLTEAIHLVRLGARVGLICQLTGLDKAPLNRLYRQVHDTPSPPGQTPFSDTWFRENDQRMLHTTIAWRLYRRFSRIGYSGAQTLIYVFSLYTRLVREPLLDVTHAAFVPRLVDMALWEERLCEACRLTFLAPVDSHDQTCPACRLYHRHRCRGCHAPLQVRPTGRRRVRCEPCARQARRGTQ